MATGRRFELTALGTFVTLGLPDGALGTAWPAMRRSFAVPVGDLGLVLLVATVGSIIIAPFIGRLLRRFGTPALLALAALCAAAAAVGYAAAPGLWLLFTVGPLAGAAGGIIDGALNTALAMTGRTRILNLLHASYGLGTSLGPLLVTLVVLAGSWRYAYVALALVDVAAALAWFVMRPGEVVPPPAASTPPSRTPITPSTGAEWTQGRARVIVALGLLVFFLYTGYEVAAGQWETSFMHFHLGLSNSAAGLSAFGYWAALTVSRIALALPAAPVAPGLVIRWGTLVSMLAAGLIWWSPSPGVAIAGFLVFALAVAGIFPALIAITPRRLGAERAQRAIPLQLGAAAGGGSGISAVIGLLVNARGLGVIGPSLLAVGFLFLLAAGLLAWAAPLPVGNSAAAIPGSER